MSNDLVSVIVPSYNRFKYLVNAVNSVLNQTYKNVEIIVINDGSDEEEYYSNQLDSKVKIIHQDKNQKEIKGFSSDAIRNVGVKEASGKYIAFLDDDDIWMNEKLEKQILALNNSEFKMSSTEGFFGYGEFKNDEAYELYNSQKFYKKIKKKYKGTKYLKRGKFPEVWDIDFIKVHNCIVLSSVVVEKEIFDLYGGFNGLPNGVSDYDCWLGLLNLTSSIYINEPLFYYDGKHGAGRNY